METNKISGGVIYINPKFRQAHINPNFLAKNSTAEKLKSKPMSSKILINPKFLDKSSSDGTTTSTINFRITEARSCKEPIKQSQGALITKNKRQIIRKSVIPSTGRPIESPKIKPKTSGLIKIGSRRLISVALMKKSYEPESPKTTVVKGNIFKLDRRPKPLARSVIKLPQSTALMKGFASQKISNNRSLSFLNINGVLYKCTKRKLHRSNNESTPVASNTTIANNNNQISRSVLVRGEKFIISSNGNKLIRSEPTSLLKMKRIDVGGLTFIAKNNDIFERTNHHTTRSHLSAAKSKSILTLSRNRVKSNIVCPIYRKLGKCSGFVSGRCVKVHDKKFVDICPKFLKETCDGKCLLSHDVSLSKMPVCRFFLLGLCVKTDCCYLHKKMSDNVELCPDFLNGYCEGAGMCKRRHEFPQSKKLLNKKRKRKSDKDLYPTKVKIVDEVCSDKGRYFVDTKAVDKNQMLIEGKMDNSIRERPSLGQLPSYIPIN